MEIKNYIEIGEKKAGKQTELAKILGISDSYIRAAKRNERGLPDAVCIELANYIEADPLEVIAASNLVTEKDERRRKVFESCFRKANSAAASMLIASIVTTVLTMAPLKPVNAGSVTPNNLHFIHYTQLVAFLDLWKNTKIPLIVSQKTLNQTPSKCPW